MDGTHAQLVLVPQISVHPVPPHLSDDEAAALPLVFATAWRMLCTRAQVRRGESMLVWGASGGVATAGIQLGHALGVRTIAVSRSAAKLEICRQLGADETIDSTTVDVVAESKRLTDGLGPHVAFDHLGAVGWEGSVRALRPGGRYVTCGATTGANPPASITRIFWKQLSMLGSTMAGRAEFTSMLRFVSEQQIHPRVDRVFALDDIVAAHSYLESAQQVGKVVLALD
jgi:NADPH:quinone reductase-like Zn-dependent oxidoreductase